MENIILTQRLRPYWKGVSAVTTTTIGTKKEASLLYGWGVCFIGSPNCQQGIHSRVGLLRSLSAGNMPRVQVTKCIPRLLQAFSTDNLLNDKEGVKTLKEFRIEVRAQCMIKRA